MANELYSTIYGEIAVDQNEQINSHGCGFTEPGWSSHEMTKVWRIRETPDAPDLPQSPIGTPFKVDIGVWPVAPNHEVGAVWTVDEWKTVHWSQAVWKENKSDVYGGYNEMWEVEMADSLTTSPVKLWYALYVENSQGMRVWDNNIGSNYEKII